MTPETTSHILLMIILFGFSAFFSIAETALFSLSSQKLKEMVDKKWIASSLLQKMKQDPRRLLTTILLGNDLINIAISILATEILASYLGFLNETLFLFISIGLTTFVIILFGEILPKNVAIRASSLFAPLVAYPLSFFAIISWPVRAILLFVSDRIISLFGGKIKTSRRMIVEEEFRALVAMGNQAEGVDPLEKKLVENVFEFSAKTVRDFITPREKMVCVSDEATLPEILGLLRKRRYSRIPVYRKQKTNIVGVLYAKELLGKKNESFHLGDYLNPPFFVSADRSVSNLLKDFQSQKIHMAFVREEENVLGLVTLDDLLRKLLEI